MSDLAKHYSRDARDLSFSSIESSASRAESSRQDVRVAALMQRMPTPREFPFPEVHSVADASPDDLPNAQHRDAPSGDVKADVPRTAGVTS